MACDLIFASSNARFNRTETRLGLVTDRGGSRPLVRRAGLARARELVVSARMPGADEAVRTGMAGWRGDPGAIAPCLRQFGADVHPFSRSATRGKKRILAAGGDSEPAGIPSMEAQTPRACLGPQGDPPERPGRFPSQKWLPAKGGFA